MKSSTSSGLPKAMGSKAQKRGRSSDQGINKDDGPLKRRRQLNEKAPTLSNIYENLAAESDDVRLEAAKNFLLRFSPENDPTVKDVETALGRLIQGLCSQRKAARVGFSLTLTELLRQIFTPKGKSIEGLHLDIASIIKMIEQKTKLHGNVSGRERRDHLIGKLFGYKAILQSAIVTEPTISSECWNMLLDHICEMACDIPWLREECGMVLVESVQSLKAQIKFKGCVEDVLKQLNAHKLVYTPEGVGVWLTVQESYEGVFPDGIWRDNDPLAKKEWIRLAKILKENFHDESGKDAGNTTKTAGANPNPSFVWDLVLSEMLRRDEQSRSEGKTKQKFPQFWSDVMDNNLFSTNSSHERKAWGFKIFSNMVKRAPEWAVPALLSPNLTRTLINQSKDQARFLHTAAISALRAVQIRAQQETTLALPIFIGLTTKDNSVGSNRHTITSTLEQILLSADDETLRKITRHLNSLILRPGSEDPAVADRRRQLAADLLLNTVKYYKQYDELGKTAISKGSWLQKVLKILIENAYFLPGQNAETRNMPLPLISNRSRIMFQERLSSCLTRLFETDISFRSDIAVSTLNMIRTKSTTKSLELVFKANQAILNTIESAFDTLDTVSSQKSGAENKAAAEGFVLLYSLTLLQVYNGEGDAVMMLADLDAAHRAMLKKDNKSTADDPEIFVEIILSFLGNPRTIFHKIAEEALSTFSSEIRTKGLQSLIDVLDTDESLQGQEELFDVENDDINDESMSSDDSDSDSDVEIVDGEAHGLENDASNASTSDDGSEDGSESQGSTNTDDSEDDAELTEFNNLLALTLQTSKPKLNGDISEESSEESDMDDDQMMALDPHLSKMFQQRSKKTSTKQQRKNARQNVIQFKSRVLDLIAIYIAKQYSNPLILDLVLPVLRRTRGQANEQNAEKAGKVLKVLFNTRTKHKASLPKPEDVESAWELLKGIHEEAKMGGGAKTHASACSSASLYVVKILVGLEKSNYSRVVDIYGDSQKAWFLEKTSTLQPVLFTQFQNWSQEKRKQRKQDE